MKNKDKIIIAILSYMQQIRKELNELEKSPNTKYTKNRIKIINLHLKHIESFIDSI
jgi:hypothetical protein